MASITLHPACLQPARTDAEPTQLSGRLSHRRIATPSRIHLPRCTRRGGSMRASLQDGHASGGGLLERNRGKLRLFLDSADPKDWEAWLPTGVFYGVTTNPLLLKKANQVCVISALKDLALAAFDMGAEEVQLQTVGESADAFFKEGMLLHEIDPRRIVVKVPITREGLKAGRRLTNNGVRVTMTACYTSHQALLAAAVGADYAAPYLGRMVDTGREGEQEVLDMKSMVENISSQMQILVASIRGPGQVAALAAEGMDCFALPKHIAEQMFFIDDTTNAAAEFEKAALYSRSAVKV